MRSLRARSQAAVLAIRVIEAVRADQQIVQNSIVQDRFFNDARNIFDFDVTVENPLRVNRDTRPMLALIETAGGVGSDQRAESTRFDFRFEGVPQRFRPFGIAAPARVTGSTLIATDKQMMRESGHRVRAVIVSVRLNWVGTHGGSARDLIEHRRASVRNEATRTSFQVRLSYFRPQRPRAVGEADGGLVGDVPTHPQLSRSSAAGGGTGELGVSE